MNNLGEGMNPGMLCKWTAMAGLGLLLAACGKAGGKQEAPKQAPPVPVSVAPAVQQTVPFALQAVGTVETVASVNVKSRLDGQIVQVGIHDGQNVEAGQLLFEIDPRPLAAQLKQVEANLARDQAQLNYAAGQEKRYADLLQRNFVSHEAYAQAKSTLDAAQALVEADRAAVDNARVQLGYTTIRSPIAGQAGKVLIGKGNLVKANDTVSLVVINQINPIYVSFAVPEQYGGEIRRHMASATLKVLATPRTNGAGPVEGKLAFVDNTVDASTGTLKLRAVFGNRDRVLWPGDFAEVVFTLRQDRDRIVVPSRAIQNGPNGTYVFAVSAAGDKVALRPVTVERTQGSLAIIGKGLAAGERVVLDGASRLTPKSTIKIVPSSPTP